MTPEELNAIRERHMLRCQLEGSTPSAIHSVLYCDIDQLFQHIDTQDQEIKRLREALTKVEAYSFGHGNTWSLYKLYESLGAINKFAREALKPTETEK